MASTALAPHGPSLQQHLVDDWQWRVPAAWQQQDMPKASHALPGVQPGQLGGIGREPLVGGGSRAAAGSGGAAPGLLRRVRGLHRDAAEAGGR
jgi:hypothetical protein